MLSSIGKGERWFCSEDEVIAAGWRKAKRPDDYQGWVMLEDGRVPKDSVAALTRQAKLFKEMVARAQASL